MVVGSYMVLKAWLNRRAKYKEIRFNLISQSLAFSFFQLFFGLYRSLNNIGLIFGDILGKIITVLIISRKINFSSASLTPRKYKYFWRRYQDIAKFQMPASLVNTSAIYTPVILLPMFFNPDNTGLFS